LNYDFGYSFDLFEMNKNTKNKNKNGSLKLKINGSSENNVSLKATDSNATLKDEDAWLPILNIAEEELRKYETEKVSI
jgi:hypothetical protein